MKKLLLLIALLLLTLSVPVRGEKKGLQEEPKINVGIKEASILPCTLPAGWS